MVNLQTGSSDFDSDPRLHDLKLLVLELLSLYSSYLWRTDTIVISKLSKSPSQISPLRLY